MRANASLLVPSNADPLLIPNFRNSEIIETLVSENRYMKSEYEMLLALYHHKKEQLEFVNQKMETDNELSKKHEHDNKVIKKENKGIEKKYDNLT